MAEISESHRIENHQYNNRAERWALASAIAAFLFGLLHLYWAVGGRIGLGDDMGAIGDRVWFLIYDIASRVIFLLFGAIALALPRSEPDTDRSRWLITACFWGGVLSLLRGGAALIQDAFMLDEINIGYLYDVIFTVGGIAFMHTARLFRNVDKRSVT